MSEWTPEREAELIEATREKCRADPRYFAERVWKDNKGVRIRCSHVHKLILKTLERARKAKIPVLIAAPRGVGKSELGMAYLLRLITEDPKGRYSIVGDMQDNAAVRVSTVKRYIESDEDFNRLYPDIEVGNQNKTDRFRLKQATHAKDSTLQAGGVMSSGVGNRSDIIFFDDVVTEKNAVLQPADIERVKKGFKGTWLPIIEPDTGWWFYICTFYAASDLSHDLMETPTVAHLHISVSEDFDCYDVREYWPDEGPEQTYTIPLWPEKWSEKAYRDRYHVLVSGGDATKWFTGYRNMVIDPDSAAFQKTPGFVRTVPTPEFDRWQHIVMYADPASSQDAAADYYAGVVLGWDPRRKGAVVLHKWKVREPLGERVKRYLDVWQHFQPHADGVEGKHELSFREELRRTAAELGIPIQARAVNHGPDAEKVGRIAAIAPAIEVGKILFDSALHPEFWDEAQLFPRGKNDDLLDALEGAWHLLKKRLWRNRQVPATFDPDAGLRSQADRSRLRTYKIPPKPLNEPFKSSRDRNARDLLWE